MRIAQVAPLVESVPPKLYGGTERVVSFLTEELVRLGHQVTLFASADSRTAANLMPMCPEALRLRGTSAWLARRARVGAGKERDLVAEAHEFFVRNETTRSVPHELRRNALDEGSDLAVHHRTPSLVAGQTLTVTLGNNQSTAN